MTIILDGFLLLLFSELGVDAMLIVLVLFLCLKTYADIRSHIANIPKRVEQVHRIDERRESKIS